MFLQVICQSMGLSKVQRQEGNDDSSDLFTMQGTGSFALKK
jgi:hypothetical protein